MSMFKKVLFVLIGFLLLQVSIVIMQIHAVNGDIFKGVDVSAKGDGSVIATLSENKTILTISGTGDMKNWYVSNIPWYNYKDKITKVDIKQGVTNIGYDAFYECSNLSSVIIPSTVKYIEGEAFLKCKNLKSVNIPESINYLGGGAFQCCENLVSVNIPNAVTEINTMTFCECRKLTNIKIPDGVTKIDIFAFQSCDNLRSIDIPSSVTEIKSHAFAFCENLSSVYILGSVKSIEEYAFDGCVNLKNIAVPSSVTNIGYDAFSSSSSSYTNLKIICKSGSVAEKYANEREYIDCVLDNNSPTITAKYSITTSTKDNVTVSITANELIQGLPGWKISSDKKVLTKTYTANVKETVTVRDLVGNTKSVSIAISNIDKTAPTLTGINVTSPETGTYKVGQTITIVATYSENIYANNSKGTIGASTAPLKIKFGSGEARNTTFSKVSGNVITYTYKIASGDNGKLLISSYSGTVYDHVGNSLKIGNKEIGGKTITADTIAPVVAIEYSTTETTSKNVEVVI